MGEGIRAPGARYVGEHVVVRALGGNGPLFFAADFFLYGQGIAGAIGKMNKPWQKMGGGGERPKKGPSSLVDKLCSGAPERDGGAGGWKAPGIAADTLRPP